MRAFPDMPWNDALLGVWLMRKHAYQSSGRNIPETIDSRVGIGHRWVGLLMRGLDLTQRWRLGGDAFARVGRDLGFD